MKEDIQSRAAAIAAALKQANRFSLMRLPNVASEEFEMIFSENPDFFFWPTGTTPARWIERRIAENPAQQAELTAASRDDKAAQEKIIQWAIDAALERSGASAGGFSFLSPPYFCSALKVRCVKIQLSRYSGHNIH